MADLKTDLALEAAQSLLASRPRGGKIPGVDMVRRTCCGYGVTSVAVRTPEGARALGKPVGRYITVELAPFFHRKKHYFRQGADCLRRQLAPLLPPIPDRQCVLVAGLGNRSLICDAVGPVTLDHLLVTRHLVAERPGLPPLTSVAALAAGVAGQTGIETEELIAGAVRHLQPAAVIVVDALTAASRHRLCATIQLSDTGLIPGSGVGNHRKAIDQAALGVPVIAVGIPTVMSGAVLARELTGAPACGDGALFVTPRDVDSRVRELGRLLGFGITAALQPRLTVEDIVGLLG